MHVFHAFTGSETRPFVLPKTVLGFEWSNTSWIYIKLWSSDAFGLITKVFGVNSYGQELQTIVYSSINNVLYHCVSKLSHVLQCNSSGGDLPLNEGSLISFVSLCLKVFLWTKKLWLSRWNLEVNFYGNVCLKQGSTS